MATPKRVEQITPLPGTNRATAKPVATAPVTPASNGERFPRELLEEIRVERERLFKEHGLFPDSSEGIRELRDAVSGS